MQLDVLPAPNGKPRIAKSKNAKRRAIVLGAVQGLILLHVGLWLLSKKLGWFGGQTISPIEPSESMQTLEGGWVNAGFVVFALALLSTLIFGRFFCGWACHLLVLQDGCAWVMKKLGVRPKPFRSRTLIWVPLAAALYMFVWPTFKRLALFPALARWWPEGIPLFKPVGLQPFRQGVGGWQLENHLTTSEFWINPETGVSFSVVMAIPTLLVAGFAAVYFLGSKGFCTYGCPYGGFFAPLDEWSPARIRVNDNCEQCGHCTATCTSNVRVHEEVHEYGMVVDPGCMKCMDCVSVCPNDALYFGFGKPAVRKGTPRDRGVKKFYDLSLGEDIAIAILFLAALFCVRDLYVWEGVPFLMSVGLAGVFSFCAFKAWRLFTRRDIVRVQNLKLKWRGRIQPAGWALVSGVVIVSALLVQNGIVNANLFRANQAERAGYWPPREIAFSPFNQEEIPESMRESAREIVTLRSRALGIMDGGFAIMSNPNRFIDIAWMQIVAGDFADAERSVRAYLDRAGLSDNLAADVTRLMMLQDRVNDAYHYTADVLRDHPEFEQVGQLHELLSQAPGVSR